MGQYNNSTNSYSASNYQVSKVLGQGNFASIQDAIDKAVTDGAASGSPKTVWIQAGPYTESLSLKPYVSLAGATDPSGSGVIVTGNAVYADAETGELSLTNIGFTSGSVDAALSFQSTASTTVHLQNIACNAGAGIGLECTGSGMIIEMVNGSISAGTEGKCLNISDGTVQLFSVLSEFTDAQSTISGGSVRISGSDLIDAFIVNGGEFEVSSSTFISGTLSCIDVTAASALIVDCKMDSSNTYLVSGTGNLLFANITATDTAKTFDPGLTLAPYQALAAPTVFYGNAEANNFLAGYTTTATAAATTTLAYDSTEQQYFTGSTTQTVLLPVTSTLKLGESFTIVNRSSGVVTVESSGANIIQAMAANSQLVVTVILTSGTTAASWNAVYSVTSGAGSISIITDSGTASGSTVTLTALDGADNCGATARFTGSGSTVVMNVTDASNNTFLGLDAGNLSYTGLNNTSLGKSTMHDLTSGEENVGVGQQCLAALQDGLRNVGLGSGALLVLTSANDNIAIGSGALAQLSNTDFNIAIGTSALTSSITDFNNIGIGHACLTSLNGGQNNVGLGYQAGMSLDTGNFNIYAGSGAGTSHNGSESSNVLLNSIGTTGDDHVFRVGAATGSGDQELLTAFISGIVGNTVSNTMMVTIDSTTDQLGVQAIPTVSGPWTDEAVSFTSASENGYFASAALTMTLPASPAQGDTVSIVADTSGSIVIQAAAGQSIRLAGVISTVAGTATNSSIGDSMQLVYRAADLTWFSLSSNGSWLLA